LHVHELSVGKPRGRALVALHADYLERIERLGVSYRANWVAEVRSGGRFSDDHVREREARLLLGKLDRPERRGTVIALDRSGRMFDSETLARRIERWCMPRAVLLIGGPLGLHRRMLDRADESWSLSPLTFPHELVRVLVAEQVYRALTLLRGIPYHK